MKPAPGAHRGEARGLSGGVAAEHAARSEAGTTAIDEIQLVSFEAAAQAYAFPIADVQEIVQVPGAITQAPQAQPHVVGVMTLRDRPALGAYALAS